MDCLDAVMPDFSALDALLPDTPLSDGELPDLLLLDACCRNAFILAVEHYTEENESGVVFFIQAADGRKKEVAIKSTGAIIAEVVTP